MVKDASSGQYVFNLQLWHERLLPYARRAARRRRGGVVPPAKSASE